MQKIKPTLFPLVIVILTVLTGGCASEIVRSPEFLSAATLSERPRIEIAKEVSVQSSSGYSRILPSGSIWELRGALPQGSAYKRVNGVFTVEGAQVHEAYIVVSGRQLVGFYLPVEQAYSPAQAVSLVINKGR